MDEQVAAGRWVVWGVGDPIPDHFFDAEAADEVGIGLAQRTDPEWAQIDDGWSLVVSADEHELKTWVDGHDSARGYAPHAGMALPDEPRKIEEPRPY